MPWPTPPKYRLRCGYCRESVLVEEPPPNPPVCKCGRGWLCRAPDVPPPAPRLLPPKDWRPTR